MKLFRLILIALLMVPAFLGWQNQAAGQNLYATLHGVVTDQSGAVIAGANLTALNTSTGISYQAVTDSKGYYVFGQLQTRGPYTITIEKPGFETFKATNLTLAKNDNREISARLTVGTSSQTIQVEANSVQAETSDTSSRRISARTRSTLSHCWRAMWSRCRRRLPARSNPPTALAPTRRTAARRRRTASWWMASMSMMARSRRPA